MRGCRDGQWGQMDCPSGDGRNGAKTSWVLTAESRLGRLRIDDGPRQRCGGLKPSLPLKAAKTPRRPLRGDIVTTTYERNMILETGKYDVIGTRPVRHDGADKVTGRALYGADVFPAGLLHAKVLRSPHAHALIKSIDVSKAEAHPAVKAVVTGADLKPVEAGTIVDLGESTVDLKYLRGNVLARDKVLYKGHAVAALAATSPHEAEEALSLIEVEYEPLPLVMSALDGMKDDAPLLHDDLVAEEIGGNGAKNSNVSNHVLWKLGDMEKGFAEADVIVEREFDTSTVHQGYIEPHTVTALWNNDDRITIWTSTQGSFTVRNNISCMFDKPVSEIKVVPMEIGGGFGGKIPVYVEPAAALLSKKSGQPVKNVMTRAEVFEGTGPTPGSHIRVKMGATRDGKITAAEAFMAYEAGAFPGGMIEAGCKCVFTAYDIPNVLIDGYDVVVNKPKTAAYRAPGSTNAAFASESVVNELAEKLGLDPIDFRAMNAAAEGSRRGDGVVNPKIGCVEVLEAMKAHPHYVAPIQGPNRGRGVAVGYWFNVGLESTAALSVNSDGTVNLIEGSTDIGGTRTSLAMQAAEVLGIAAEEVHPTVVDTDSIGYTAVTGGSRVTFSTGWAVYEAAQDVKRQLIDRAAAIWEVGSDTLEMEKGVIRSKADPRAQDDVQGAGRRPERDGRADHRSRRRRPQDGGRIVLGKHRGRGGRPRHGQGDDTALHRIPGRRQGHSPQLRRGADAGGTTQGIGWALNEEYFMDDSGQMTNSTLLDYRMPISLDLPMIDTVIVEAPNPGHPFGVRGVGEASIAPPPAALTNAIYGATGIWMRSLPMNPAAVMDAVWENSK